MPGGRAVLVVEDNERNMKLVRELLQASRLPGPRGDDRRAGPSSWPANARPALVLMDIRLPGYRRRRGTLTAAGGHDRTASIPVLAVTAQAMQGDRERFLAAGFDGYLSKPIDVGELLETVSPRTAWRPSGDRRRERPAPRRRRRSRERAPARGAARAAAGTRSIAATDGSTGLELAESARPDLVLLDVVMPPPGRLYRLQARSESGRRRAMLPVIMLTARPCLGEDAGARGRRRRLPREAARPRRVVRARSLAAAREALPRHDQRGRRPGAEPDAGGARPGPGRRARAVAPPATLPLAAARRR